MENITLEKGYWLIGWIVIWTFACILQDSHSQISAALVGGYVGLLIWRIR